MALRSPLTVQPYDYIADSNGRPLDYGQVYIGVANQDPEFYQIPVYLDAAMTKPIDQPIRTNDGFVDFAGSLSELYASAEVYSVKVLDKEGRKVLYKGDMTRKNLMSDALADLNQSIIDTQTAAQITLNAAVNSANTEVAQTVSLATAAIDTATTKSNKAATDADAAIKTLFENGGLPATPFATKALMEASALVDGKYAMVTDGGVDNGLYVKTAGAWVKSGYDPLTQAKSYTDAAKSSAATDATIKANNAVVESVVYSLSDIAAEKSGNLLDTSMFIIGNLQTSGEVLAHSTSSYTQNYIPMNEFSKYVLETSPGTGQYLGGAICFYDKNKALISGTLLFDIPVGSQIVVPSGTYYMRTSCSNANLPAFRISVTTTTTTDAATKANTAKTEAIAAAATDATNKANAVKSYTDSAISAIDFGAPVLTGQAIYDKAVTTNEKFTAIWSEYNKPVWHIGDSVFVDAVGATVNVVKQEFVMTYKLTEENQTVRVPLVSKDGATAYVDWGDGTANYINRTANMHTYSNAIGDEFVVTITGELEEFNVPASIEGNRTADCIKSIDKNTLPKTTTSFTLRDCKNLVSLCDGAFSSLAGDSLNLELYKNAPNVTYSNNLFAGLQNVKNIDNLFVTVGTDITGITYSPELFRFFTGVTSAKNLFFNYKGNLTKEHLEAMTELQYAYRMLSSIDGVIDSDVLTNQTKLIDVNQCFYLSKSATTSALPIYQHLLNNNPNLTNYAECFKFATMQDMGSIPAEWK